MNKMPYDINDDEIRIISSEKNGDFNNNRLPDHKFKRVAVVVIAAILMILCIVYVVVHYGVDADSGDRLELTTSDREEVVATDVVRGDSSVVETVGRGVVISDTVINNVALSMFVPENLTPTLHIGTDVLSDSTAVFVVQAADVRKDNGGIVGAYVKEGELISKGQAKAGFCAIIGGKINIGVADATPFLEHALETDGYFFRQYPLVVGGQVVENKPKGESLRRALAEIDGQAVVVMSKEKMTFHDFSQSLVDLGVSNAIYLVGGPGYGFAIGKEGEKTEFGLIWNGMLPNTNYIVWR